MWEFFIGTVNGLFSAINGLITGLTSILPDSPFALISNSPVQQYMSGLNWILPLDQVIAELEVWIVAVGIFYIYQIVLRWVKAIE